MNITIRPAEERDLPAILALERAADSAPHWPEENYAAMLHNSENRPLRRRLLVADDGAQILGFAIGKVITLPEATESELESIVVAAKARRSGVGRALCESIAGWAYAAGANSMALEVRASNSAAIGLYTALKFAPTAVRKSYYERPAEDALLMMCILR